MEEEKTNNNDTFSSDFQPQQKCLTSSRSLAFYHGMAFVLYIQKLMKVFHIMKRQTRSTIAAAFQLCFHFWGCFIPPLTHPRTHTYIFFPRFFPAFRFLGQWTLHRFLFWKRMRNVSPSNRAPRSMDQIYPSHHRTPPPLLLGVIHRDNRNVTCLRGVGNMPLHRGK